jgi:putative oxygen-independent coproporphyrinogen III oxidase
LVKGNAFLTDSDSPGLAAPGLALYVHWPFCLSKCPYCDFNSHVSAGVDHDRWRRALVAELRHYGEQTGRRTVGSVFFGGGTPSLMAPATVAAVLETAADLWTLAPDVEITLEANPTSVEAARFQGFRAAGVNRLSLGVQALNPADLAFLGRKHSAEEALAAIDLARRTFPRYSFDLITARPGQTVTAWRAELAQALALAGDHLSLYQLTIEEGTAFHPMFARGDFVIPDEDLAADLFEATQEVMNAAGMPAYEVSNHARPGGESRHNLAYWRYGDYVGVGPGAHGRLTLDGPEGGTKWATKWATRGRRAPESWLQAVERDGHGGHAPEEVDADGRFTECLMMGLRLSEGLPLRRLAGESGRSAENLFPPGVVARLIDGGFVTLNEEAGGERRLTPTAAGRQRLGAVLAALAG